ncbi:hypothetical protein Tco_0540374, partial [Tanacetum coccineum]
MLMAIIDDRQYHYETARRDTGSRLDAGVPRDSEPLQARDQARTDASPQGEKSQGQ